MTSLSLGSSTVNIVSLFLVIHFESLFLADPLPIVIASLEMSYCASDIEGRPSSSVGRDVKELEKHEYQVRTPAW